MKLLLDTHIWLGGFGDAKRLPARIAKAINATDNELWLSPISVWEVELLIEAGRLRMKGDPQRWIANALEVSRLTEAPVTYEVARESRRIGLAHQDPADRFIAATASVYDLVLATVDQRLLAGTGFRTIGE